MNNSYSPISLLESFSDNSEYIYPSHINSRIDRLNHLEKYIHQCLIELKALQKSNSINYIDINSQLKILLNKYFRIKNSPNHIETWAKHLTKLAFMASTKSLASKEPILLKIQTLDIAVSDYLLLKNPDHTS